MASTKGPDTLDCSMRRQGALIEMSFEPELWERITHGINTVGYALVRCNNKLVQLRLTEFKGANRDKRTIEALEVKVERLEIELYNCRVVTELQSKAAMNERTEVERLQGICGRVALMIGEMQMGLSHYRLQDVLKELAKAEHAPQGAR